jgi:hypothetical protein
MICQTCEKLICRCFLEVHKRQPEGKVYKPLTDDLDEVMAEIAKERRARDRAYYENYARKNR